MALKTYIAEGFMEDCDILVHKLTESYETVNWHNFCYHWKEMQFDIIFYGRQSGPEVVEFTEELLQIARLYIVTEIDNFEDQIVGLFIAYAIIESQPYKNLCSLRLVPDDVAPLKRIEAIARRDNRQDVLMILGKLYIHGNTQFHVSVRERAMDITIRKYFDNSTNVPQCVARRWHGVLGRHNVKAFEDIANDESKYAELKDKAKLMLEKALPDTNILTDTYKPGAEQIAGSLKNLIAGVREENKKNVDEDFVGALKRKAMKNTVDPMRHLHGLEERQKANDLKAQPKSPTMPSKTKSKKKSTIRNKPTQKPVLETCQGISLPVLNDDILAVDDPPDNRNDPPDDLKLNRNRSPQAPFPGFTAEEINESKRKISSKTSNVQDPSKQVDTNSNTSKKKPFSAAEKTKPPDKTYKTNKVPIPFARKRMNSSDQEHKKKRKPKNKDNQKLKINKEIYHGNTHSNDNHGYKHSNDNYGNKHSNDNYGNNHSNDNISNDSIEEVVENNANPTEMCKGRELSIQTKGEVKHFVQFEVSDLVIRTEKTVLPAKDIEIEFIDNYKGSNAYEEVCEVSDDDERNDERKDDESKAGGDCDDNREAQDDMELFEVITEGKDSDENEKAGTTRNRKVQEIKGDGESDVITDDTLKRILNKTRHNLERRKLKQPNLRSKLKKMGLLPVANFNDDSS